MLVKTCHGRLDVTLPVGRLAETATGVMVRLNELSFPWLPMLE